MRRPKITPFHIDNLTSQSQHPVHNDKKILKEGWSYGDKNKYHTPGVRKEPLAFCDSIRAFNITGIGPSANYYCCNSIIIMIVPKSQRANSVIYLVL